MLDVLVIGDRPGDLSAALFLAKNGLAVAVYGQDKTAMHWALLRNYLGIAEILGADFQKIARAQVEQLGDASTMSASKRTGPRLAKQLGLDYDESTGIATDRNGLAGFRSRNGPRPARVIVMTRSIVAFTASSLVLCAASIGLADSVRPDVRAIYGPGGDVVRLLTTWSGHAGAELYVGSSKIKLFDGEVVGTVVAGHDRVIVALAVAREPFRVYVLDGKESGEPTKIARPGQRRDAPFAVAATATPDGFSVFFQEVQTDDGTAAHTYMVKLDENGKVDGAAAEIAVPWSLGAAAWNGTGYHLALFYPGDQNGMRLSMVSLSAAGQPNEHPDWASAAGFISDVHLVASNDKVTAYYRGGKAADRLLESEVTTIGSWGQEPAKAKDHGKLDPDKAIAVTADGAAKKVTGASMR